MNEKFINIKGKLLSTQKTLVMGILNVTPDSFHTESRKQNEIDIHQRIEEILSEGGQIIDVGACSSRPGATLVTENVEKARLKSAFDILKSYKDAIVSVDTFRASIARYAVEEYGVSIINDISGGRLDANMFSAVAELRTPYILMHSRGTPEEMQQMTNYENVLVDVRKDLADKIYELQLLGINDIIIDPGFGFGKTLEQNYELMANLNEFQIFNMPILVGISRKSMIFKLLETTPEFSLNGTTALNVIALLNGADILRVHDVKEAVETVKIVNQYKEYISPKSIVVCGHK